MVTECRGNGAQMSRFWGKTDRRKQAVFAWAGPQVFYFQPRRHLAECLADRGRVPAGSPARSPPPHAESPATTCPLPLTSQNPLCRIPASPRHPKRHPIHIFPFTPHPTRQPIAYSTNYPIRLSASCDHKVLPARTRLRVRRSERFAKFDNVCKLLGSFRVEIRVNQLHPHE